MPWKRSLSMLLVFSLVAVAPGARISAADSDAEQVIRTLSEKVLVILQDQSLSTDAKSDRLKSLLDTCCDFETTSKLTLARNWRTLSDAQADEFTGLFKDYLIASYWQNIDTYQGETVKVSGGREEPRGDYTVHTTIKRAGEPDIFVNYRMRKSNEGKWRIIDVVAEGISLVSNLRSQFQELISSGGPEKLLNALRKKIAET